MSDAPTSRDLDIRISAAATIGFSVWEAGVVVASLTSRAEVANWIEERLGMVPGEKDREERERADFERQYGNVERMPSVVRPRTEPPSRLWGRRS